MAAEGRWPLPNTSATGPRVDGSDGGAVGDERRPDQGDGDGRARAIDGDRILVGAEGTAVSERSGGPARVEPAARRGPGRIRKLGLVVVTALVVALASSAALAGFGVGPRFDSSVPAFSHVYLIVLENQSDRVLTSGAAPYLRDLANRYGFAANYDAVTHPSQPNYVALFSGSTQSVNGDTPVTLSRQNLADQLEAHGKTWRVFAENVPSGCFLGDQASGGPDGPGTYLRRHEPAIEFKDVSGNPARCANITDLSQFDPAAADFELIVPNACHDMHDCGVQQGDAFLRSFVPRILASPAWQQGGVLFVTFDESSDLQTTDGGNTPLLVVSRSVGPGFTSTAGHDHYSLLRTIEDAWGLGCLEQACSANNLSEFFGH